MKPTPYINFNGNAKEAFEYYAKHLGGKILFSMTYADAPPQPAGTPPPIPAASRGERQDHAHPHAARRRVSSWPAIVPPTATTSRRASPSALDAKDPAEAKRYYDALAVKGEVFMPLGETFWAKAFAMLKDQFGIPWMINCEKEKF